MQGKVIKVRYCSNNLALINKTVDRFMQPCGMDDCAESAVCAVGEILATRHMEELDLARFQIKCRDLYFHVKVNLIR